MGNEVEKQELKKDEAGAEGISSALDAVKKVSEVLHGGGWGSTPTKEPDRWEKREAARDARDQAELENVQQHRAHIDAENKRGNDLHEQWIAENKRFHDAALANEEKRFVLIEREVSALERIAATLAALPKG